MSDRRKRFTAQQASAMLRSIAEDDSGGESEFDEGDVLDRELCSSDEMDDDEETEQLSDSQSANTNVESHSTTCCDGDSCLGAAESLIKNETARDGTQWEFMEFGVEARGKRAAQMF
ncbi:unnamed protein product [Clavelina lepadiformis]|uniref:Uncharacterized protein n=1 Tax=Clavelina lepadiformis TaxID=159417 RepID=A0ABP0GEZ2_CLALP